MYTLSKRLLLLLVSFSSAALVSCASVEAETAPAAPVFSITTTVGSGITVTRTVTVPTLCTSTYEPPEYSSQDIPHGAPDAYAIKKEQAIAIALKQIPEAAAAEAKIWAFPPINPEYYATFTPPVYAGVTFPPNYYDPTWNVQFTGISVTLAELQALGWENKFPSGMQAGGPFVCIQVRLSALTGDVISRRASLFPPNSVGE
jgi:hypothetical protein